MQRLSSQEAQDLIAAAEEARSASYSPYSNFAVGAALLDDRGGIHIGTNVENASYGLTICAERVAIGSAVAVGKRSFNAIAVVGPADTPHCTPCGSCRQVLFEFNPSLQIIVKGPAGDPVYLQLGDLLPDAFGPSTLGEQDPKENA